MKQIDRTKFKTPSILSNKEKQKEWYSKISKNEKGKFKISSNWNSYDEIRETLLQMSNNKCMYCGRNIKDISEIEHYLPSAIYPQLAYEWLNYLISCSICNKNKNRLYCSEENKSKCDIAINGKYDNTNKLFPKDGYNFKNFEFHKESTYRVIDPTYDDINKYIKFECSQNRYLVKNSSIIGEITLKIFSFYVDRDTGKSSNEIIKLSEVIKNLVKDDKSLNEILEINEAFGGDYDYLIEDYYNYWKFYKDKNLIDEF